MPAISQQAFQLKTLCNVLRTGKINGAPLPEDELFIVWLKSCRVEFNSAHQDKI